MVEHATLDLRVVSLSPMLSVEITYKKKKKKDESMDEGLRTMFCFLALNVHRPMISFHMVTLVS